MKKQYRILKLSVKSKPFEVMISGEKKIEYRKPSNWIKSRLFKDENTLFSDIKTTKKYDFVKFTNGYGKNRPYFICEYLGLKINESSQEIKYSNNLLVNIEIGDFSILLGAIVEIGNYNISYKRPFSTLTEYLSWQSLNCFNCAKYENISTSIEKAKCKYAFSLDLASVDLGSIPIHIINEVGLFNSPICLKFKKK